ncbi:MAG: hypothetical protein AB7T14_09455 [Candidatus Methylacidiphilaceae bacterium]
MSKPMAFYIGTLLFLGSFFLFGSIKRDDLVTLESLRRRLPSLNAEQTLRLLQRVDPKILESLISTPEGSMELAAGFLWPKVKGESSYLKRDYPQVYNYSKKLTGVAMQLPKQTLDLLYHWSTSLVPGLDERFHKLQPDEIFSTRASIIDAYQYAAMPRQTYQDIQALDDIWRLGPWEKNADSVTIGKRLKGSILSMGSERFLALLSTPIGAEHFLRMFAKIGGVIGPFMYKWNFFTLPHWFFEDLQRLVFMPSYSEAMRLFELDASRRLTGIDEGPRAVTSVLASVADILQSQEMIDRINAVRHQFEDVPPEFDAKLMPRPVANSSAQSESGSKR